MGRYGVAQALLEKKEGAAGLREKSKGASFWQKVFVAKQEAAGRGSGVKRTCMSWFSGTASAAGPLPLRKAL